MAAHLTDQCVCGVVIAAIIKAVGTAVNWGREKPGVFNSSALMKYLSATSRLIGLRLPYSEAYVRYVPVRL